MLFKKKSRCASMRNVYMCYTPNEIEIGQVKLRQCLVFFSFFTPYKQAASMKQRMSKYIYLAISCNMYFLRFFSIYVVCSKLCQVVNLLSLFFRQARIAFTTAFPFPKPDGSDMAGVVSATPGKRQLCPSRPRRNRLATYRVCATPSRRPFFHFQ